MACTTLKGKMRLYTDSRCCSFVSVAAAAAAGVCGGGGGGGAGALCTFCQICDACVLSENHRPIRYDCAPDSVKGPAAERTRTHQDEQDGAVRRERLDRAIVERVVCRVDVLPVALPARAHVRRRVAATVRAVDAAQLKLLCERAVSTVHARSVI